MSASYNVAPNPNDPGVSGVLPVGALVLWGTMTAPPGYLMCDGGTYSTTTYAHLFSVIGTTFGDGNGPGTNTFSVPNTSQKTIRGVGAAPFTLATAGGNDTITLVANQLPNHGHTITDPTHTHDAVGLGLGYTAADGSNGNRASLAPTAAASTGITIADSLLSGGVQVTQFATTITNPYIAINYIIKSA